MSLLKGLRVGDIGGRHFCLIGDILLIPHSRKFFCWGWLPSLGASSILAAFFTGLSSFNLWWLVIALILKVFFIFHYALAVAEIPKELFIPVNLYIVVISLMVAVAASGVGGGGIG